MINYFILQEQWKKFAEAISKDKALDPVNADEAIWPYIISGYAGISKEVILVVASTRERAFQLKQEMSCLIKEADLALFTGMSSSIFLKGKTPDHQSIFNRLNTLKTLLGRGERAPVIIATASSLVNLIPASRIKDIELLHIKKAKEYDLSWIMDWLVNNGYERVNQVYDRGEFSVRGDIINIFDITSDKIIQVDVLIDEVEKISLVEPESRKNAGSREEISIFPNLDLWKIDPGESIGFDKEMADLFDIIKKLKGNFTTILCDPVEVYLKLKSDLDLLERIFEREPKDLIIKDREVLSRYLASPDIFEKKAYGFRLDLLSTGSGESPQKRFVFSTLSRQKKSLGNAEIFIDNIKADLKSKKNIIISTDSASRIKKIKDILLGNSISFGSLSPGDPSIEMLKHGIAYIDDKKLYRGFSSRDLSVYGELDIYQQMEKAESRVDAFNGPDLKPGEYVVHKNHGIGIYIDTISRQVGGNKREYFLIEYGKGDKLYIPTWNADRINKYIGSKKPVVTPLDSKYWDSLKKRVRKSVKKLAVDLALLYAQRQSAEGYAFPPDSDWQKEIEADFGFRETEDQAKAIEYVKKAMESQNPMDVLVIGDVGFGKTEVAIRAAFKAIEDGKQVLMLVPTTILADQHYMTFSERFRDYPVMVEVLSRFRKKKDQKKIVEDFSAGNVDMLIGTHRVLQKDVIPSDLGLIIVDEEQRFGVNSKEKIKLLKKQIDVLTLSATPIPRTLYMSMAGVKDMALIETFPEGRNPIETFVGELDYSIIANACEREMARGGQVYYVYNRISGIFQKADRLARLLPEARIVVTHGQMDGQKIERVMSGFIDRKYDILLTTSIIESGMDIENVNTLIVEDSHRFGLSQLYQLRGRVGRSSEQAYAYLFYPGRRNLGTTAYQRLKTLAEYTDLGSGYNIAMKDLEIRGAGEILGPRQHGHINSIGYDMYCQIIKEEVDRLKGVEIAEDINIQIDLPISAYIPKNYIGSARERISAYKKLGAAGDFKIIDDISRQMIKRYGRPSGAVKNLIGLARIKAVMRKANIESLRFSSGKGIMIKEIKLDGKKAAALLTGDDIKYQPRYGQVTIKNIGKNIDLNIVIKRLNDIIGAM